MSINKMSIKPKKNFLKKLENTDYVLKNILAKFGDDQSTFLHSTPLNKIVLEWVIYPVEIIKSRTG